MFKFRKLVASALAAFSIAASASAASIEINLPAHTLSVFENGVRVGIYPVAIGKYSTPTPTGEFSIINMEVDPIWTDPETMESVESGDWNPLGYRWMGFYGRYGIHGNSNPDSIGLSVSNGCVRMFNDDVEAVFEIMDVGDDVRIIYDRAFVEHGSDGDALYIYPDCYDEQPLDVDDVRDLIEKSGAVGILSDDEIEEALEDESGEPIYLAQTMPVYIDGKEIADKAVSRSGTLYFPVGGIARVLGADAKWDGNKFSIDGKEVGGTVFGRRAFASDKVGVEKLLGVKIFVGQNVFIVREKPAGEVGKIKQGTDMDSFSSAVDKAEQKSDVKSSEKNNKTELDKGKEGKEKNGNENDKAKK